MRRIVSLRKHSRERVSSSLDTLKSGEADEVNDFDHGVCVSRHHLYLMGCPIHIKDDVHPLLLCTAIWNTDP